MELPKKPSALIRRALIDLGKCEKSDLYRINMFVWHWPDGNGVCEVDLGGAAMAQTLKFPSKVLIRPKDLQLPISNKLIALHYFSLGEVYNGMKILGTDIPFENPLRTSLIVTEYRDNAKAFKRDMRLMAACLDGFGL